MFLVIHRYSFFSKDLEGKKHHFGASGQNTPSVSRKTSAEFRMAAPEGEAISMCKPSDKVWNYVTRDVEIRLSHEHLHSFNLNLFLFSG